MHIAYFLWLGRCNTEKTYFLHVNIPNRGVDKC